MTKLDDLLQKATEARAAIIAKETGAGERVADAFTPAPDQEEDK